MSARCRRALSPCATPASAPLACIAPSRSLMNPWVSIPEDRVLGFVLVVVDGVVYTLGQNPVE